jgi:hypothetical protein
LGLSNWYLPLRALSLLLTNFFESAKQGAWPFEKVLVLHCNGNNAFSQPNFEKSTSKK